VINTITCSPQDALDVIDALTGLNRSIFLWGSPGAGKSTIVKTLATRNGAGFIDARLSQMVNSDLIGLPFADMDRGVTTFLRPDWLPTAPGPGFLFLDELTLAEEQVRAAAYQLILDRKLGDYSVPDGWVIVAASNRPEDNAISCDLGTALNDRVIHLNVEASAESWLTWAMSNGIHPAVCAYIKHRPDRLTATNDDLNSDNVVLPSPRSWHAVSDVLFHLEKKKRVHPDTASIAICGLVGKAIGLEFVALAEQVQSLPLPEKLFAAKDRAALHKMLPGTLDLMTALCYSITGAVTEKTATRAFWVINNISGHTVKTTNDDNALTVSADEIATLGGTLLSQRCLELDIDVLDDEEFEKYDRAFSLIAA
jgi:hypothetical protein